MADNLQKTEKSVENFQPIGEYCTQNFSKKLNIFPSLTINKIKMMPSGITLDFKVCSTK